MGRRDAEKVTSFLVMDILERAQQLERAGKRIIHLEIGQPDFPTPACVDEAAIKAVRDGHSGYTHSLGIWPLREAIAAYYETEYAATVSPERIVVTNGTSPAMLLLFSALFDKGDAVLMPDPTYACYAGCAMFCGAEALSVPTKEEHGFQLQADEAAAALGPKVRGIIVNSPSNPAGTLAERHNLEKLASLGPILVSDEIYHGLVYEGRAHSALQFSDACCVLDGFSKRYAMTGWRLGWMVIPDGYMPLIQRLQQNFVICANSVAQWAGVAALKEAGPDTRRMAAAYKRRRDILVRRLRELGFGIASRPAGAFYVLANARHLGGDSLRLAYDILEKAGVGVTPGIDFGPGAEGYLRFSYANSEENIEEGMRRLEQYVTRAL